MNKIKASLLHFTISLLVVLSFIIFLYFVWYRNLFFVSDVLQPLKLLFLVDVILGPLLTFVVYKKGKEKLKMDLSLIVLMQLSAFIYGAYTIYTGKPSWVIHNGGQFELVFEREVGKKLDKLSPPSLFAAPKYGFIRLENANINLMAYQNLAVVELLTEQNRKEISYFKLDVKKVVTWLKLTSEELQYKLSAELTGLDFYPISNNGMESVLVISKDDLSKIQVITEY